MSESLPRDPGGVIQPLARASPGLVSGRPLRVRPVRLSQPAGGHFKLSVSAGGLANVSGGPSKRAGGPCLGSRESLSRGQL